MADYTLEELEAFEKKIEDFKESFDAEYIEKYGDASVSYTHLTLPTIYSV